MTTQTTTFRFDTAGRDLTDLPGLWDESDTLLPASHPRAQESRYWTAHAAALRAERDHAAAIAAYRAGRLTRGALNAAYRVLIAADDAYRAVLAEAQL